MLDNVHLADRPLARSKAARHGRDWPFWAAPLAALILAGLKYAHFLDAETAPVALVAALLLIGSVFAAVHHAEVVAHKVGEPFGSIVLALAVTAIETSLIVSSMLSGGALEDSLARDTVFSVVMIVLNGVVGLCIVVGALRYREQTFRVEGVGSALRRCPKTIASFRETSARCCSSILDGMSLGSWLRVAISASETLMPFG